MSVCVFVIIILAYLFSEGQQTLIRFKTCTINSGQKVRVIYPI